MRVACFVHNQRIRELVYNITKDCLKDGEVVKSEREWPLGAWSSPDIIVLDAANALGGHQLPGRPTVVYSSGYAIVYPDRLPAHTPVIFAHDDATLQYAITRAAMETRTATRYRDAVDG